jgi:hypothetical protein
MPLPIPNLDDRKYTDLVEEARALIPTYAPEWTNHNPSDPGITLIELFAYLSEMLLYRLNRVTSANVCSFLRLLNGPGWKPSGETPEALAEDVQNTMRALRKLERAVSCDDFETLALEADKRVARARCLPRRNLLADVEKEKPGHVSVIILPKRESEQSLPELIESVREYLEPRRLLTTHVHVVGPQYLEVEIKTAIVPMPDVLEADIKQKVVNAVIKFLDPHEGGENEKGWPFGRNVFASEIYGLIDQLQGVDYVTSIDVDYVTSIDLGPPGRRLQSERGEVIGIEVKPYELVKAKMSPDDVTVQTPQ